MTAALATVVSVLLLCSVLHLPHGMPECWMACTGGNRPKAGTGCQLHWHDQLKTCHSHEKLLPSWHHTKSVVMCAVLCEW